MPEPTGDETAPPLAVVTDNEPAPEFLASIPSSSPDTLAALITKQNPLG